MRIVIGVGVAVLIIIIVVPIVKALVIAAPIPTVSHADTISSLQNKK
jgi:hypothetical protein